MLFPEGVLVDLPVLSAIEPEGVGHERLGLLPHLVGLDGPMCKVRRPMRIKTSSEYAWHTDLYDVIGDRLGKNTCSGAVDGTCEFTREMLGNLERAVKHPDMTEELAKILSTHVVDVEYGVLSSVTVVERPPR